MKRWLILFICSAFLTASLGKPLRHKMKVVEELPLPPNAEFFQRWGMGLGPAAAMGYWLKLLSTVGGWVAGDNLKQSEAATSLASINQFEKNRGWMVAYLDGIIRLSPTFPEPYLYAGVMLYWFSNGRQEAMDFLARGVDARINRWEIPYYLGYFQYTAGNYEKSYHYYRIATEYPGVPHVAPLMLSLAASRSGNAEAALTMLDSLLENLPENMEQFRYLIEADREQQAKLVLLVKAAQAYQEQTGKRLESLTQLVELGLASSEDIKLSTGSYRVEEGSVVYHPTGE